MNRPQSSDSIGRGARHRAAMRTKGYRLKQFWLPDVRTPAFKDRARRDALLIAAETAQSGDLDFAETIQHWPKLDD